MPTDVNLARRVWLVEAAKDDSPVGLWLNSDMLAAWKLFIEAKAWGTFDTTEFAKVLRQAGWPAGIRPYNARHAVGQDLSKQGEDLQDIADWLGQKDTETTRQHYVPVLNSRLRGLSERIYGRLGWGQDEDEIDDVCPTCGQTMKAAKAPKRKAS